MRQPITKTEQVKRYEEEINQRTVALETIRDRIVRGGYAPTSAPALAIGRKCARMERRIATLQTELMALLNS